MKPREHRHEVQIPARLRWEGGWVPASVRNISSRGMMLRLAKPPPRGTYVDIELTSRIVTGRVVWSNGQSCGFQLQDKIDVAGFRGVRTLGRAPRAAAAISAAPVRRRSAEEEAARSRVASSMFQYLVFAAIGLTTAGLLASEVAGILSAPIDAITETLD